ncbi:unnamed protein product [Pleuronectes platessa]|uniref:General transcription factor IIE subunit 1 n=1 Tax=Pleuronectes platessa TaxID=8262 RepID=A0A9N7VV49_PLEPL|nr:unnamed protein product [Pleuronectes platessa]
MCPVGTQGQSRKMIEPDLLTEVPAALKRLAKQVVRGFYEVEHALALDTKVVKCRMRVETASDGKTTRHNYYFINYRVLVNVVKYKLDHMRRRIETDERDSTNRASFRCPCCFSTFTDLEANQLFDPMTGTFRCTFCQTEVEEDESVCPDARTQVARFNEQIEPIYALLRETEDVNLSHDLLEPEPGEIPALKQSRERAAAAAGMTGPHREAWSTKGSTYGDMYTQNVVINMEEQGDQQKQTSEAKAVKERPVWLTQSTVQGAYSEPDVISNRGDIAPEVIDGAAAHGVGQGDENEEVMRALLIHEKRGAAAAEKGGASTAAKGPKSTKATGSDSDSDTSESDDNLPTGPPPAAAAQHRALVEEDDDEDEFEEVGDEPMVMVGGRQFSYREVSQRPELVEQMSAQEKEAYIEKGQNLFQDMYF